MNEDQVKINNYILKHIDKIEVINQVLTFNINDQYCIRVTESYTNVCEIKNLVTLYQYATSEEIYRKIQEKYEELIKRTRKNFLDLLEEIEISSHKI